MLFNLNIKIWGVWFEFVFYYVEYYLFFEGFIKEEFD